MRPAEANAEAQLGGLAAAAPAWLMTLA